MAKLKIKVTKLAYYRNQLVYPNEIIKDYEGDVPSWGTLADGKAAKKQEEKTPVEPKEPEAPVVNPEDGNKSDNDNTGENDGEKTPEAPVVNPEEKTDIQLQEELNTLLDESVAKGILLEDAEKKTIEEQIAELKVLLGK